MSSLLDDLRTTYASQSDNSVARQMHSHLGAIGELMRGEIDFAKGALPNQSPDRIIPNGSEVFRREFSEELLPSRSMRGFGNHLLQKLTIGIGELHRISPTVSQTVQCDMARQ